VFGPRQLASENNRYDFHRGIDMDTTVGTSVFAVADGTVISTLDGTVISTLDGTVISTIDGASADSFILIYHDQDVRSVVENCLVSPRYLGNHGYYSRYKHLNSIEVNRCDPVFKGNVIGSSGVGESGLPQLHFEIRYVPPDGSNGTWRRYAINPLGVLPYDSRGKTTTMTIDWDELSLNPIVTVTVESYRADVNYVGLSIYDNNNDFVDQPAHALDDNKYDVNPPWFNMNELNFQYTHEDSTMTHPWDSFGEVGDPNECPYIPHHLDENGQRTEWDGRRSPHVHLDRQDPSNSSFGLFNGVRIAPEAYSNGNYYLRLTFNELNGPAHCIIGSVEFAAGGRETTYHGEGCFGVRFANWWRRLSIERIGSFIIESSREYIRRNSSVLAWRVPGTAEPSGLPSMGSQSRTRLK